MEPATDGARVANRQPSFCLPQALVHRLPLLGLLHKISSLAAYLLLIRILSAAGFIVALWLCPVQIFASLGLYLASLSLAAIAVFGRYELLIVVARDEQQRADSVYLCTLTAAVAAALLVAVIVNRLFVTQIAVCFAVALFARAWLRLGLTFATRYGRYDRALKALFPHAIGQPFVLVFLLHHGYHPLIAFVLSDIIGHMIAAAGVCISEWRAFHFFFRQPVRYRRVCELALANFRLPTVNLTAAASAFLFAITPLFFLPGLPNGILAGTLALLFRVLDVPTSLTSASLSPILMKEVADRNRDGTQWMLRSTLLLPAIIATLVFGLISLGGLTLNSLHLAPTWHMALTILPVVALFQASIAATSPLIDVATLAGRQRGLLAFNIVAVGAAGSVFLLWSNDPVFAIVLAGSIGFARVIAISIWLLASGERGILGSPSIAGARIQAG
jgi:hypothetical protein